MAAYLMPLYKLTNGVELWAHCECTRADRRVLRQYREQCEEWARLRVEIGWEFIVLESGLFYWDDIILRRAWEVLKTESKLEIRHLVFTRHGLKIIKVRKLNERGDWKNVWLFVARLAKVMQYWKAECWREEWPEEFR